MEEAKKKEKSKIRIRKILKERKVNRGKLKRNKELNKELK